MKVGFLQSTFFLIITFLRKSIMSFLGHFHWYDSIVHNFFLILLATVTTFPWSRETSFLPCSNSGFENSVFPYFDNYHSLVTLVFIRQCYFSSLLFYRISWSRVNYNIIIVVVVVVIIALGFLWYKSACLYC